MSKKGLHSITLFEIVIVLVVCIGLGVFLIRPMRIARQTAVVKPMTDLGARTATNTDRSVRRLDATRMPADEIRMEQIIGLADLRYLNLDHSEVVDADLAPIAVHLDLRELHVVATEVTDKSIEHIAEMENLVLLDARATFISDDGIAGLSGLKKLQFLRIAQTWITDAALESIAQFPALRFLDLRYTGITDVALPKIATMNLLTEVRLTGAHVHESAVDELRSQRPDLKIEFTEKDGYNYNSRVILRPKNYKNKTNDSRSKRKFRQCEREIGEELESIGARVRLHDGYITGVICKNDAFNDRHLQQLRWCRNLAYLNLRNPSITADGWSLINRNRFLQDITVYQLVLDPDATRHISSLWHMNAFTTDGMTDDALRAMNSRVYRLELNNSPLTDASIESITSEQFPRLASISADHTDITDAAAERVEKRIRNLHVFTPRECRESERQAEIQRKRREREQKLRRDKQQRDRIELERMVREAEAERAAERKQK